MPCSTMVLTSILCRLKASLSSDVAAFPRKRWGSILTGKSLSSSNPNEESQRSSESLESVLLVAADEQEEPKWWWCCCCCCCLWNKTGSSAYSTHIVAHFQDCFDISSRHSNWMSVGVNMFYFKTVQLIQHFTHCILKNTVNVLSERDFRHSPCCPQDLCCAGLFCTIAWVVTNPLGWRIGPTFKGEDVHRYQTNVTCAATQKREDRKVVERVSSIVLQLTLGYTRHIPKTVLGIFSLTRRHHI